MSSSRKMNNSSEIIDQLLTRGVEEVIVREHLAIALKSGKKLRVKFGVDPTSADLHLGHMVVLRKLHAFQHAGHDIILIIGDYTARVGDPSGRSKTRPMLSDAEITTNAKTYLDQVGKILDVAHIEIRHNSEWLGNKGFDFMLWLMSQFTAQHILERDDFSKRIKSGVEVYAHEMVYPMLQAYDSVEIKADIELGGTDQTFNMLAGRDLQRHMHLPEQDVITLPLLRGTDGVHKMSKSLGNYIGITETPNVMFGKIMSIPDALIDEYYNLCTDADPSTRSPLRSVSSEGQAGQDPRTAKLELGSIIVDMYHAKGDGAKARAEFERVFSHKGKPSEIQSVKISAGGGSSAGGKNFGLIDLLVMTKLAKSKSEARRLIEQGGVKIDDIKQIDTDAVIDVSSPRLVQVGPRKFVRVSL